MIEREHQSLSVSRQCRLLGVSRSTLYYRPLGESAATLELMRRIDELYLKYPFYGSRQMVRHLAREGVAVGRHRVRRLMRLLGLEAIYRKPRTSVANPEHRVYPYLLRGLTIERPNQVWCADITYIPAGRVPVPGGDHGLGQPAGAGVAVVQHDGHRVLPGGAGGGAGKLALPEIFNTEGQPVHQYRVHWIAGAVLYAVRWTVAVGVWTTRSSNAAALPEVSRQYTCTICRMAPWRSG